MLQASEFKSEKAIKTKHPARTTGTRPKLSDKGTKEELTERNANHE
jgi:hypothetical protein